VLADFGLKPEEFYVLGVLRRTGAPYRLAPTALARTLLLTTASITHRVDRLQAAGLVARTPDPDDRRGVLVGLTPAGLDVADRTVEVLGAVERRTVEGLTAREGEQLARLLRKLLVALGDTPGTGRPRRQSY
jgi:DNA-binding MarR family transcriptional regulator